MNEAAIPNLDQWLLKLMEGMPAEPRRYEFRCHPDVVLALRAAEPPPDYDPHSGLAAGAGQPAYGSADIVVRLELGSGGWELYENGELLKAGRLGEGDETT